MILTRLFLNTKATCLVTTVTACLSSAPAVHAQVAPALNTADPFAVLGGSAVTAAGGVGTIITGEVGVSPGSSISGFPPAVTTDPPLHFTDSFANSAHSDTATAYNFLKA